MSMKTDDKTKTRTLLKNQTGLVPGDIYGLCARRIYTRYLQGLSRYRIKK